nr:MAG TPA: hypothetical protein [Microviridae sp.]
MSWLSAAGSGIIGTLTSSYHCVLSLSCVLLV